MVSRVRLVLALCALLLTSTTLVAQTDSLVLLAPTGGEIFYTTRDTLVTVLWGGVPDTVFVRLEFSTDGRRWNVIADSVQGLQYQWNVRGLQPASTYRLRVLQARPPRSSDHVTYTGHNSSVAGGAWSPTGDRIVSISARPHIWDAEVGGSVPLVELQGPRATYTAVEWSKDSTRIVASTEESGALSFATTTNSVETVLNHPDAVRKIVVANNGSRVLTVCDDNRVRIWDLPSAEAVRTITSISQLLNAQMDSLAERALVCADDARVYPISGGLPVTFANHEFGVLAAEFHPDATRVASIGGDTSIRLWNATTAVQLWSQSDPAEGVRSLAFSPMGDKLAVGMSDSTATVWDVQTGDRIATYNGTGGAIHMVQFSPDGELVATVGDVFTSHVFNASTGARVASLQHRNFVTSARWSPDGTRILTTSRDGTAIVWRIREFVLQADTSDVFSIAPPPPAFARFRATGDTIHIADETTLTLRMEGASQLDLADIDSVAFQLKYNSSVLHLLESTIPVVSTGDSLQYRVLTLAPIALPRSDQQLGALRFRATLGTDSTTTLQYRRVTQIGSGPGIRVETVSDTVLLKGICRATNQPRLYNPIGVPLSVTVMKQGASASLMIRLPETGQVDISVYSMCGELMIATSDVLAKDSEPVLYVPLDAGIAESLLFVVVRTASSTNTTTCWIGQ